MELIVGDELWLSDDSSEIVLPLFFVHEGQCFPWEQWTDFASVLNMWAYDLIRYQDIETGKFELPFMDGPYRLEIIKSGRDLEIRCVNPNEKQTKLTVSCTYTDVLELVSKASYQVGKMLYSREMHQGKYGPVYRQAMMTGKALKAAADGENAAMAILQGKEE